MTEWQAFYDLEPFGDMRADLRAGIVASTVANVMGDPKKPLSPSDFMPLLESDKTSGTQPVMQVTDPDQQSKLIMATLFGVTEPPKPGYVIPED